MNEQERHLSFSESEAPEGPLDAPQKRPEELNVLLVAFFREHNPYAPRIPIVRFVLVHCDILARTRVLAEFYWGNHEIKFSDTRYSNFSDA